MEEAAELAAGGSADVEEGRGGGGLAGVGEELAHAGLLRHAHPAPGAGGPQEAGEGREVEAGLAENLPLSQGAEVEDKAEGWAVRAGDDGEGVGEEVAGEVCGSGLELGV